MKKRLVDYLRCPLSRGKLELEIRESDGDEIVEGSLSSTEGRKYPIHNGIPRFVTFDTYTKSFGFQWNRHARIYLDNKDKRRLFGTKDQLRQKLGLSPETIQGKFVLDVGCGTGANGAVVAGWGAREVICIDLSNAVEAAYDNTRGFNNIHVVQADLLHLPLVTESFDTVYSNIGVLYHTPDTAKAFHSLVPFVKFEGTIAIWVYPDSPDWGQRLSDRLRTVTTRLNPRLL